MTTFEAKDGKRVRTPKGIVNFKGGTLETDDKDVIEALRKAQSVSEVKSKPEKKSDKGDKK